MKARNTGHIINIGSVAGREPYIGGSIYCATKHAVNAFTGSLLRELVETQIKVTEIQPGKKLRICRLSPTRLLQAWSKQSSPSSAFVETSLQQTRFTMAYNPVESFIPTCGTVIKLLHSCCRGHCRRNCLGGHPAPTCEHC
jgi:NAD(P)-dependent dehydrogenase (short-subunit alcohol dehydrogenase family)